MKNLPTSNGLNKPMEAATTAVIKGIPIPSPKNIGGSFFILFFFQPYRTTNNVWIARKLVKRLLESKP